MLCNQHILHNHKLQEQCCSFMWVERVGVIYFLRRKVVLWMSDLYKSSLWELQQINIEVGAMICLSCLTAFPHKRAMSFSIFLATGSTPCSLISPMQIFTVTAGVSTMGGAPSAGDSFLPYCLSGQIDESCCIFCIYSGPLRKKGWFT